MNLVTSQLNRRSLLRRFAAGVMACTCPSAVLTSRTAAALPDRPMTPTEFKSKLRGAVLSIPTPFTRDMQVDYAGVRGMIERGIPYNIRVVSLTSGNSQYASLKHEEILELTRVMVDATAGRGITIAATGDWDLPKTLEYARYAEEAGADGLQVLKPTTENDGEVVEFFQSVADGTKMPLVLHGVFEHPLLEKLLAIDSIVALKEDVGMEYYIQVQRKFGERMVTFGGGPEFAFLVAHPYGARASYATLGTFVPQLTQQFWQAIDRNDMASAYALVKKYEHPFFDRWSHAFWRASLEHFRVASRYLRPPEKSFTDQQMVEVAEFYRSLGFTTL